MIKEQADLGVWLFLAWWGGCWLAYYMSRKSSRDTRLLPMVFGITIATFFVCFHGRAPHWHFWWYAWNTIPNAVLLVTAWYAPTARARIPLLALSLAGMAIDAAFFGFAATGNRLPGACYFCLAATVETLQVASMLYFSGPVEPVIRKARTFISTRKWPWTHQQLHRA